jgi:hypothetical protein
MSIQVYSQVYIQVYIQCVSRRNKPRSVGRFPSHYAGRYVSRSPLSPHFYIQKNLFPEQKRKTSATCSYSQFSPCYTIPNMCLFGIHACTPCPLCIVAVAVFAVFVALCPATPCLAFDACLCPVFVCRKRIPGGEGGLRRGRVPPHKNNHTQLRPLMRILIIKFHIAILPPLIFKHITPSSYLHINET